MMASTTQMNFRVDPALKASGDLTLRENGVTPSALIRSVWEYLSRNRHKPDTVARLMVFLKSDGAAENATAKSTPDPEARALAEAAVMAGPNIVRQFRENIGIDADELEPLSYEELKLEAYSEKYPILN